MTEIIFNRNREIERLSIALDRANETLKKLRSDIIRCEETSTFNKTLAHKSRNNALVLASDLVSSSNIGSPADRVALTRLILSRREG